MPNRVFLFLQAGPGIFPGAIKISIMAIGDEMFLDRLYAAEDRVREQAHGFDDKASYLLIILTFLAELVERLRFSHRMLVLVSVLICISAVCAVAELGFVKYRNEDAVLYAEYRKEVIASNPGAASDVIGRLLRRGLMTATKKRILYNQRINQWKGYLLVTSYAAMVLALVTSIIKLAQG